MLVEFPGGKPKPTEVTAKPSGASSAWVQDLLGDDSVALLARRVKQLRAAVDRCLLASSKEYRVLVSLAGAGLAGSESCQRELAAGLAANPHFIVLNKLDDAERALAVATRSAIGPGAFFGSLDASAPSTALDPATAWTERAL
jgi:hypothetical protein